LPHETSQAPFDQVDQRIFSDNMKPYSRIHRLGTALFLVCSAALPVHAAMRPFTVVDEIELADFGDNATDAINWSPDRKWVAAHAERGLVRQNRMQSELRIYSVDALKKYVAGSSGAPPAPVWSIRLATYKEGPIVRNIRWTADSNALAFIAMMADGRQQLTLAELGSRTLRPLSSPGQDVTAFDVRDRTHYVYAVRDPAILQPPVSHVASSIVTGRSLYDLMFPVDRYPEQAKLYDRSELWAAKGGSPDLVKDPVDGRPVKLFAEGLQSLRLSPDGAWLLTAEAVQTVPASWVTWPVVLQAYRIHAGAQNLDAFVGAVQLVSKYVLIDLQNGKTFSPLDAPTGHAMGWYVDAPPAWSRDSRYVLLPSQFLPTAGGRANTASPCVTVVNVDDRSAACVEALQPPYTPAGEYNAGRDSIKNIGFDATGRDAIIAFAGPGPHPNGVRRYVHASDRKWVLAAADDHDSAGESDLKLEVRQSYQDPPVLVAGDPKGVQSRIVWDPNPQLKNVALGQVSVLHWKDVDGRDGTAGLYKPADYTEGKLYPLVIQMHGFDESVFRPSGIYPTGFAARALAAAGMVVLQVRDCPVRVTPDEGPCQVRGYEAAVKLLMEQRMIDPGRTGIVGFSRTCYYVLEALTRSRLDIAAASVTDGVDGGYWQYLLGLDAFGGGTAKEANAMNASAPFGKGLQTWLRNAPTFNMDKVHAPLQVVAEGPLSLIYMWEPYAALRYLGKPVELELLDTDEHVLTQPAVRIASQGGTMDWMRFWLQGYEDPDPVKTEQYRRWEGLCDLQRAQNAGSRSFCPIAKH
jgi:hypothetical protein